jgi:hypothetical protein
MSRGLWREGLQIRPYGEIYVTDAIAVTLDFKFTNIGADEDKGGKKLALEPTIGVNYSF